MTIEQENLNRAASIALDVYRAIEKAAGISLPEFTAPDDMLTSIVAKFPQPTPDYVRGMERAAEICVESSAVCAENVNERNAPDYVAYIEALEVAAKAIRKEAAEQAPAVEVTEAMVEAAAMAIIEVSVGYQVNHTNVFQMALAQAEAALRAAHAAQEAGK